MTEAGWGLIIVGTLLVVARTGVELRALWRKKDPSEKTLDLGPLGGVEISLKDVAELMKVPHGPAIALVISGAVLLLAGSGVDVSLGGTVTSPTPTPTAT